MTMAGKGATAKAPYKWRDLPQGTNIWYIGGHYQGRRGILEWCMDFKDALDRANIMARRADIYDIRVMRWVDK